MEIDETILSRRWTQGVCETCAKNSHEIVRMSREKLSSDAMDVEIFVCPTCGATKLV